MRFHLGLTRTFESATVLSDADRFGEIGIAKVVHGFAAVDGGFVYQNNIALFADP